VTIAQVAVVCGVAVAEIERILRYPRQRNLRLITGITGLVIMSRITIALPVRPASFSTVSQEFRTAGSALENGADRAKRRFAGMERCSRLACRRVIDRYADHPSERQFAFGPGAPALVGGSPYRAASIFGIPTSFTARVRLYASAVRLNSARTFSRPRIRK
jgi:hypothetical protein